MRMTAVLRQAVQQPTSKKKSLALSVYFAHPELTQGRSEILSRATAFLWGIDPPSALDAVHELEHTMTNSHAPFAHLDAAVARRHERERQQTKEPTPVMRRNVSLRDMSWLEYAPREARPQVHVVASSHVVSPFLWKQYYSQPWLDVVRQEHCSYALEVYEEGHEGPAAITNVDERPPTPLVKLACHPTPYHHPEGRDIALIHLQQEESALQVLRKLGVQVLYLRDTDKLFQKGETMIFEGYSVQEPDANKTRDVETPAVTPAETDDDLDLSSDEDTDDEQEVEDLRIFQHYHQEGTLSFHTDGRFFAQTAQPLPEGVCGAPVLDTEGDLCGVVEGIVPVDHPNTKLAGSAAFLPSYQVAAFVDYCERQMLQDVMPPDLFQMVVNAKKTNSFSGAAFQLDDEGNPQQVGWDEAHDTMVDKLKQKYTAKEVDSFLKVIEHERDEVLRRMDASGGGDNEDDDGDDADLDQIIAQVRRETLALRDKIHEEYRKNQQQEETTTPTTGTTSE